MRLITYGFALALLATSVACGEDLAGPVDATENLAVGFVGDSLRIRNVGTERVFYISFENGLEASALFSPCTRQSRCPSLAAGDEVTVAAPRPRAGVAGVWRFWLIYWRDVPGEAELGPGGGVVIERR